MSFRVGVWNARDSLGNPELSGAALEQIKKIDSDVIVLPEAYAEEAKNSDDLKASVEALGAQGYHCKTVLYADKDGRADRHGLLVASRLGLFMKQVVDMKPRKSVRLLVDDSELGDPIMVYGVHFDDRQHTTRANQARRIIETQKRFVEDYNREPNESAYIVAGDFNDMPRDGLRATALRASYLITKHLPSVEPRHEAKHFHQVKHFSSLAQRLGQMANGNVLQLFEEAGLTDADPTSQPTKGPVQLDHIMYSTGLVASDFKLHDKYPSDHHAISVTINT